MKQINLWNGRSHLITDEKALTVKKWLADGDKTSIITTDTGWFIISAVCDCCEIETEPYFMGKKMNKALTKVFSQGEWKSFCGRKDQIKFLPKINGEAKLNLINK